MPLLEHNGASIHYGDEGSGDFLVLMHAAGSSGAQWRGVLPLLTDRYRVITPDLYGHGRTDFWPDPDAKAHDRVAVDASQALCRADADAFGQSADCGDLFVIWKDIHC